MGNKNQINMSNSNNNILSKNKMSNKINNNNYYKLKKVINPNEQKKNQRPGLKENNNKTIHFDAMVVGSYRGYENTLTIINIHSGEKYMVDHTHIQLSQSIDELLEKYDYTTSLIHAVGKIYSYGKGDDTRFSIKLLDENEISFIDDKFYNINYNNELFIDNDIDTDKVYEKLTYSRHNDFLDYINLLRIKINEMTDSYLNKDFLYHYIINQYSLNSLNQDLYEDSLQTDQFDDGDLYKLIIILSNVLFDLQANESITLINLMRHIVLSLNALQGVIDINCKKDESKIINKQFRQYCERLRIGFGKGWEMVTNRNRNFDIDEYFNLKDLSYTAMLSGYNIFK